MALSIVSFTACVLRSSGMALNAFERLNYAHKTGIACPNTFHIGHTAEPAGHLLYHH